jgi:hypothetical protein
MGSNWYVIIFVWYLLQKKSVHKCKTEHAPSCQIAQKNMFQSYMRANTISITKTQILHQPFTQTSKV